LDGEKEGWVGNAEIGEGEAKTGRVSIACQRWEGLEGMGWGRTWVSWDGWRWNID